MGSESLWTACTACGKSISIGVKKCPHCGQKRTKYTALKIAGACIAVVFVIAAIGSQNSETDGRRASKNEVEVARESRRTDFTERQNIPEAQSRLLSITADYKTRFTAASNELQQSVLRDNRRDAILGQIQPNRDVNGWIGKIASLETNTEGKAILVVRLSQNTTAGTWNNALSDFADATLIEKASPVYSSLMSMKVGDVVEISGNFLASETDGIKETSVTIAGSMRDPDFLFQFTKIRKPQGD